MDDTGSPTTEIGDAEAVQNLEREVAEAEERVADLQRRVRVAEVEAEAAVQAKQFDPTSVAPTLTAPSLRRDSPRSSKRVRGANRTMTIHEALSGAFSWAAWSAP